ncbi:MAG TPA: TonB family protein [Acetobacteraceae bacterium]|jgi:protein TonB|nr:TonB family protein [Acetobacteraceae bacterium]
MTLPERQPRRLGPLLTASLALHLSILILLLLGIERRYPLHEAPPPADIAMVFEGHSPERNSGPNPLLPNPKQPGSPAPAPSTPPVPPIPATPPPLAALPPPPPPAPPAPAEAQIAPPTPALVPTPAPAPTPTPPAVALLTPRAVPVPPLPQAEPTPRRPAATPEPRRAPAFPSPLAFSFGRSAPMARSPDGPAVPTARTAPAPPVRLAHPGTLDLSFDPRLGGSLAPSSTVLMEGVPVSTDWLNEVSAWWQRHAYYPPQAGLNNEDGDVTLHMRVDRDGHVTHLELVSKSGSQWLDLGALAIFRDAYLPPLPPGTSEAQIPFHVTIHFVIVR